MAEIKLRPLIENIKGSIYKITFYSIRQKNFARKKLVRTDPNTTAQQTERQQFLIVASLWTLQPEEIQTYWHSRAQGQDLTHYNKFQKTNLQKKNANIELELTQNNNIEDLNYFEYYHDTKKTTAKIFHNTNGNNGKNYLQLYAIPNGAPYNTFQSLHYEIAVHSAKPFIITGLPLSQTFDFYGYYTQGNYGAPYYWSKSKKAIQRNAGGQKMIGEIIAWHWRTVQKVNSTTTATKSFSLIDSSQHFLTTCQIGNLVLCGSPYTMNKITNIISDTEIELLFDDITAGEVYQIYGSEYALEENYPCDGSVINDPDSPLDGFTTPDLNGQQYFLRGGQWTGHIQAQETAVNSLSVQNETGHTHPMSGVETGNPTTNHTHGLTGTGEHSHKFYLDILGAPVELTHVTDLKNKFTAEYNDGHGGGHVHTIGNDSPAHKHSLSGVTIGGGVNHLHAISGGSETRPANMTVMYLIKYK